MSRRVLPGFRLSVGATILYLGVLVVVPLGACVLKAASLSPPQFWAAVSSERARAAYALTFGAALSSAAVSTFLGLVLAWVLVRYEFPGRRFLDSMIDLPFALPTAVAGLVFSTMLVKTGWYGRWLTAVGLELDYARTPTVIAAIVVVLVFIGLPFAVRTVQPVLESLEGDIEEAAASLGATRTQTFFRVILPSLGPGLTTGFALSFARCLGEYGSVIFVSSNAPFRTEIAPFLIVVRLEEFKYEEAAAIAVMLLVASLASLLLINWLERRSARYAP